MQYSILAILVMLVITTILTLINKENPTIPSPVLRVVNDLMNERELHSTGPFVRNRIYWPSLDFLFEKGLVPHSIQY